MSSTLAMGHPALGSTIPLRGRGLSTLYAAQATAQQLLPTDPQGTAALTLTGLIAGSVVRIETAGAGALVETRTASGVTEAFSLPVYGLGSPNNNLRVKVRKGTAAPYYIPWETLATVAVGSQSIYVSQIPDE